ncbi:MAG TPA: hypothetical protein DHE23_01830 [Agrobacterium sp.]|nr:hypothetical protein [Agrobacterium sp.]
MGEDIGKAGSEPAPSAPEPVAARHDFDGHGFQYIDSGSGSDWKTRKPDAEMLYAAPPAPAVAVKALQAIANYRHHSRLDTDENAEAMEQIARSALSAQVQDVPTARDALQAIANLPTGDNLHVCQGQEEAYRAVEAIFSTPPNVEVQDVAGWQPPQDCDGREQLAFETWAANNRYDMHEHPLHYLFMDPKTNAARQGWKAALQYVRDQFPVAPAKQEGGNVTSQ